MCVLVDQTDVLAEKELDLRGLVGLWVQISVLLFMIGIRASNVIFLTLGPPSVEDGHL